MATTKTKDQLQQENDMLNEKLNNLESMMKTLMSGGIPPVQETQPIASSSSVDEFEFMEPNKMIKVMSLFYGTLNLVKSNGQAITFYKFGEIKTISYADLQEICERQRSFAEDGYFMILNETVVKNFYLDDFYKRILSKDIIENIITMEERKIRDLYIGSAISTKEAIIDTIINGINKNDPRFSDRTKINIFNELCGRDLQEDARAILEYDVKK